MPAPSRQATSPVDWVTPGWRQDTSARGAAGDRGMSNPLDRAWSVLFCAFVGAGVGFALGVGSILLWNAINPELDQGALAIFVTAPGGLALGAVAGGIVGALRRSGRDGEP